MPEKLDRCVEKLMAKGRSKSSAFAICNESLKDSNAEIEQPQQPTNDKLYLKAFLLDATVNRNKWGVDPATLEQNIRTYIGKPLVLQENLDHPDSGDSNYDHVLQYQEKFRVGNIIDIVNKDNIYSAIVEITDPLAKKAINLGELPLTVSPQLYHDAYATEDPASMKTWHGTHLAIVHTPAFGVMKARIGSQCSGSADTCLAQLKSAAVEQSHCNCVKRAIVNYLSSLQGNSSSNIRTQLDSLSLQQSTDGQQTNQQAPPAPLTAEEAQRLRAENEALKAKISSLEGVNTQLTEENKTVSASLQATQKEYRRDKVTGLLSAVFYPNDEKRKQAIDSFTKSNMSYEEIEEITSPLKRASVAGQQDTKVVIKSASESDTSDGNNTNGNTNRLPYWANLQEQITGGGL